MSGPPRGAESAALGANRQTLHIDGDLEDLHFVGDEVCRIRHGFFLWILNAHPLSARARTRTHAIQFLGGAHIHSTSARRWCLKNRDTGQNFGITGWNSGTTHVFGDDEGKWVFDTINQRMHAHRASAGLLLTYRGTQRVSCILCLHAFFESSKTPHHADCQCCAAA